MSAFEEFGVLPEIIRAVEELEWELPTPVQAEAIPLILGGGDVMAAAETGSGKTGAFAIPIVQLIYEELRAPQVSSANQPRVSQEEVSSSCLLDDRFRDGGLNLTPSCLVCFSDLAQWQGCIGRVGVNQGAYYFEAIIEGAGISRVGWSRQGSKLALGTDGGGFGYGGTAKKSNNNKFDNYGESYQLGDVITSFIDFGNNTVSFAKNGKFLGVAFQIPEAFRKDPSFFYPAVTIKQGRITFNFGASGPFRFPVTDGHYVPLAQANPSHTSLSTPPPAATTSSGQRTPLAIILEPARELAEQTHEAINSFKKYLPAPIIETSLLVGGAPNSNQQMQELKQHCDIVTGTTGRIIAMLETRKLNLSKIRFFVLDEADRLLDTGNYDPIMTIFNTVPKTNHLQVLMFSATLHSESIQTLSQTITRFPTWVDLKGRDAVPETVEHKLLYVDPVTMGNLVNAQPSVQTDQIHHRDHIKGNNGPESLSERVKLLKAQMLKKLLTTNKFDQALIFVRTKLDADNLENFLLGSSGKSKGALLESEFSCAVLHGGRAPNERRENLQNFKDGQVRFLICTDVAARGLDIKELPYVINYTLPDKAEDYIHRIGRVGRADRMGLAISLVSKHKEKVWYHTCPSKGKSCNNSNLLEKGGCAIWYDEPDLLKQIEERIQGKIPEVGPDFKVSESREVSYGQKREGGYGLQVVAHLQDLAQNVQQLSQLETTAQQRFWHLKQKYPHRSP